MKKKEFESQLKKIEGRVDKSSKLILKDISKLKKNVVKKENKKDFKKKRNFFKIIYYIFLLLLIIIILNQFFRWEFIIQNTIFIAIFTSLLGILTFVYNKKAFKKKIKIENKKEELKEEIRKKEFITKFPKINNFPIIKNLIKWMYKEGWIYSFILILFLLIGFYLRLNISFLDSIQGSWHMLRSALGIINYGIPIMDSGVIYLRSIVYQYLLAGSIYLFGFNSFAAIFPGLVFSTLTIPLIYLITKKINKIFAIISIIFFALSGYLISYGTYRNYSIAIFFILLSLYYSLDIKKKNYRIYYLISSIFAINSNEVAAIVISFPFLISFLDSSSINNFILKFKKNLLNYSFILLILFYIINSIFLIGYNIPDSFGIDNFNSYNLYSSFIFSDTIKFFYFEDIFSSLFGPLLFISLICLIFLMFRKDYKHLSLFFMIFLIGYIIISLIGGFKQQPRMIFFIVPFILLFIAYFIYHSFRIGIKNKLFVIIIVIILSLLLNSTVLSFHLNKNFGSKIPDEVLESNVFTHISNLKEQAEFVNKLNSVSLIITSNRWFDFYSDKNYILITKRNWIKDQVYQYYNNSYRYLFTNIPVIYKKDDLISIIKENCKNKGRIIFTDFPDFNVVMNEMDKDKIIRNNWIRIFSSGFESDYSNVWELDCSFFNSFDNK